MGKCRGNCGKDTRSQQEAGQRAPYAGAEALSTKDPRKFSGASVGLADISVCAPHIWWKTKVPEPPVSELVKKFQLILFQKKGIWWNKHAYRKFLFFLKKFICMCSSVTQPNFSKKAAFSMSPYCKFISLYLEIRLILRKVLCLQLNSCGLYFILLTSLHCCHNWHWYWESQWRPSVRLIIIPRLIALDVYDLDQASALKHKPDTSFWKHL